jgi:hypothetical protein
LIVLPGIAARQRCFSGWQEAGSHQAVIDESGLVSGVYLLRLEAGEMKAVKKLILLR